MLFGCCFFVLRGIPRKTKHAFFQYILHSYPFIFFAYTVSGVLNPMAMWGRFALYNPTTSSTLSLTSCTLAKCSPSSHSCFRMPFTTLAKCSPSSHSCFRIPFTRSAIALSYGEPSCVMLIFIPLWDKVETYCSLQYWQPRSEWWTNPASAASSTWHTNGGPILQAQRPPPGIPHGTERARDRRCPGWDAHASP